MGLRGDPGSGLSSSEAYVTADRRAAARSAGVGPDMSSAAASSVGSIERHPASLVSASNARPARNSSSSDQAGPISWRPTGSPSDRPHGIESPGSPAMFTGSVQASDRYIATG